MKHKHKCPCCGLDWECSDVGKVWDQEDTDCRWFAALPCPTCTQGIAESLCDSIGVRP